MFLQDLVNRGHKLLDHAETIAKNVSTATEQLVGAAPLELTKVETEAKTAFGGAIGEVEKLINRLESTIAYFETSTKPLADATGNPA